jgi:DNA-binding MarR family transcriptional regulator
MTAPFVPLDPDAQLGYLLVRAADQLTKTWNAAMRAQGINPRQFSMLATLAHDPGISQGELARRVLVTPQSMSESLASLIAAGWVDRVDAAPGHPAQLRVSATGRRLLGRAYPVVEATNRDGFAALTSKERQELLRILGKLVASEPRDGALSES